MYKLTVFRKIFSLKLGKIAVVPLVGTWIEIYPTRICFNVNDVTSFPSWERGLKLLTPITLPHFATVVPLVGTWIEMS